MIVAMGVDRIYGFQLFYGSISSPDFAGFIINILDHYDEIKNNRSKYIFYVDNCSTHHSLLV